MIDPKPGNPESADLPAQPSQPDAELPETEINDEEDSGKGDGVTVVGVGASAGGLEAFSELLNFLPVDTGMCFVLVQHLDPLHESILPGLLAGKTAMPVVQVHDGTAVQPDHVYVVPPNVEMAIEKRILRLHPRSIGIERHRPIDSFFLSLAADARANAIGIVLSGTASDGTLGLKAIKNHGGITIAQDFSAKFDSMPRNAIAAGFVDFVLSPRSIAEEISAISKHPFRRSTQFKLDENSKTMSRILAMLRAHSGVDFAQYKPATLLRRLSRRMVLRKAEDAEEYLRLLQQEQSEIQVLFDELLINVTEFFRDPAVLINAARVAFPALLSNRETSESIRVWVPGCATGEEVYSLAMALLEFLGERHADFPIQMFGTDVSEAVIARARAGFYDENGMTNVSPERRRRFFSRVNGGYQISQQVRDRCVFSRHNIAKDPPLSRMDVVSCRNLLIYFAPALQVRVVNTLTYALRAEGILILGSSETLGSVTEYFAVLDEKTKIYSRRGDRFPSPLETMDRFAAAGPHQRDAVTAMRGVHDHDAAGSVLRHVDRLLIPPFQQGAVVADEQLNIIEIRGDMHDFLKPLPPGETQSNLLVSVCEGIFGEVQRLIEEVRRSYNSRTCSSTFAYKKTGKRFVRITVSPLDVPSFRPHYLILFEHADAPETGRPEAKPMAAAGDAQGLPSRIPFLESELASTRQYLQSIIEELRSANEEAQSSNEELQSINEELQTAKEELQSSNEELHTINAEMQSRNVELAQVNDDLINLLGSMNMPVVMISGDLRIRRFTPVAEKVLHLIPTDVGRPISDIKPRINVPNLEGILQEVLDTLVVSDQEVQDFNGNWYSMRVRPYRTSDNRIQGAVLQLHDIGVLKRSLEEVSHARNYVQAIVDTVREPLLVLDQGLQVQNANRSFYDYFSITEQAAAGQNIREVGQGAFSSTMLEPLLKQMVAEGTRINDLEVLYRDPNAGERNLIINVRSLRSIEKAGLLLLAFEDVTERKRADEARYRRLFEAARDGIIIADAASGAITDVNPFVEKLCGYTREELVGRALWEIEPLADAPFIKAAVGQIKEQGVMRFPDLVLRSRDGRTLHTEVVANSYSEKSGQAIQLNIRDLTERKKFERDLQHTQKLESLGLLAGGIAHDFNNLLTGILGNASLAYTDTPEDQPTRKFMRSIMDAAERAAFLTQQMLAYAGRGRFVKKTIELGKLVQEISPLIRTSIPKNVELVLDLDPTVPPVDADAGQMQQVIMNLIINGAEATAEGKSGRVEVRTAVREITREQIGQDSAEHSLEPGRYVSVEVKDNGIGMNEETRARIFDPFFTTKFTGRGLGLAAVQGIIRSHHGTIRVYSTPGLGTTLEFLIPVSKNPPPVTAPIRPLKTESAKGTVLVIDDEEMIRTLAASILTRQGYQVLTGENGAAGIEALRRDPKAVSLVVLDLLMPGMSGEEALDRLREIRPDVPVILTSGFDESDAVQRFTGRKLAGFLQKPFSNDGLLRAVSQVLASVPK